MPSRCVVYSCSNVPDIENGIVLHKIPYDQDVRPEAIMRRKRWFDFVKRKCANWEPTNSSCICSRHFAPDAFERMLNLPGLEKTYRPLLKQDTIGITAFPTVYAADDTGDELFNREVRAIKRKVRKTLIFVLGFRGQLHRVLFANYGF